MSEGGSRTVLVVDDHDRERRMLGGMLEDEGWRVEEAPSADDAFGLVTPGRFDAMVLDVNMPGPDGLTALLRFAELDPALAMVIVTGEVLVQRAGDYVVKHGAYAVIPKMPEPEYLLGVLDQAARLTRHRRHAAAEAAPLGIVGESPAVRAMMEQVRRIAPSQGRVLVLGENGSGKELAAQALHALSKRAQGPFVKINCAAIPRDLVESELFGYERGAFTGALQSKRGRLELADGGTLFLDEVGDLSLEAQAKLLRVIETGEVERVGGTRTAHVDVRIVAATNKDLGVALENGDFREDLYYRLNVLPLRVPPLRERRGDVPLLATHFLGIFCAAEGRPPKRLSDEACRLLDEYHWPGNVRELRNLMERAAILVDGEEVRAEDLAPWLEGPAPREEGSGLRGEIERREAEAIRKALEAAGWNVTQAAAGLGIDRTNLHRKMRKYGIRRHE
ncbi:MAG TPA: sigma-54 dependent transcriptional regulator [Terriglobales bacterium]|nr:sigma-54 dependent transcriptional regulator [Terriglobales bacterium]